MSAPSKSEAPSDTVLDTSLTSNPGAYEDLHKKTKGSYWSLTILFLYIDDFYSKRHFAKHFRGIQI